MTPFSDLKPIEPWLPPISQTQVAKLLKYCEILYRKAMPAGFTGDCSPEILLQRHLLDSLLPLTSPAKGLFLPGVHFCDLGSGAGLPGIPLAICQPQVKFTAIEASSRRAAFLEETKEALGLENFEVYGKEIQLHNTAALADGVIYRAFRKPLASLELALHVLRVGGCALYYRANPLDFSLPAVADRLLALGYQVAAFYVFAAPPELGNRGMYHFIHDKPPAQGFPRPWHKIQRDPLCEKFA